MLILFLFLSYQIPYVEANPSGWISPTGHSSTYWQNPTNVYDEDTNTYGYQTVNINSWSEFLYLTHSAITSNKVRFNAKYDYYKQNQIDLDVYRDGAWVNVYQGSYSHHVWVEKTFDEGTVTQARARFFNPSTVEFSDIRFYEFDFWEVPKPPTLDTQDATDVTSYSAYLHGNITDAGSGNVLERGFDWDEDSGQPYANSWTEEGSYGIGSFEHLINSLDFNKTYYFRAKARNVDGWGYGNEKNFTTKEAGEMLPLTKEHSSNILISGSDFGLTFSSGDSLGIQNNYVLFFDVESGLWNGSSGSITVYEDRGRFSFYAENDSVLEVSCPDAPNGFDLSVSGASYSKTERFVWNVNIASGNTVTFVWRWRLPNWLDLYFSFGVGMSGLILMVFAPTWVAFGLRRKAFDPDKIERIGIAILLFCIGFALFITWLWT